MGVTDDWKDKRWKLYLRRSQGESGTTNDQLARVMPMLMKMVSEGKLNAQDLDLIKGKAFNKEWKGKKLEGENFTIYNEGRAESAWDVTRPVFEQMIKDAIAEKTHLIIAETQDRFARDAFDFGEIANEAVREGVGFYGIIDNAVLTTDPNDRLLGAVKMQIGGYSKKLEIEKAAQGRYGTPVDIGELDIKGSALERGYVTGNPIRWDFVFGLRDPQTGTKRPKFDIRDISQRMLSAKINPKTMRPTNERELANEYKIDRNFGRNWWWRIDGMNRLGVLEEWLQNIEAMRDYIQSKGKYPARTLRDNTDVGRLLYATRAYLRYPAGFVRGGTKTFIKHPAPLDVGIDRIATAADRKGNSNAPSLEQWKVVTEILDDEQLELLDDIQLQLRTREKGKYISKKEEERRGKEARKF